MCEKITSAQNGEVLSIDEEIAECVNDYFTNITDNLDIDLYFVEVPNQLTMVLRAIENIRILPQ